MPIKRQLTDEELAELDRQGYDVSQVPKDGVTVLSPEEQQQQALKAQGEQQGQLGAVGATLKGHAGSLIGGGAGALTAGAVVPAIAASWAGGPVTGIPGTLLGLGAMAAGGLAGSYAGQKAQEAILPQATNQQLQQAAVAAQAAYPKTALATDVGAGALLSGGRPSLTVPSLAGSGLKKILTQGIASQLLPQEASAIRNVVTMNAANLGVNAGLQAATTGKVDPTELAASGLAGVAFSQPNFLGRKLLKWEPLSRSAAPQAETQATPYTIEDGQIQTVEQRQARQKQQGNEDWQRQQLETQQANEYSAQQAAQLEAQQQQQRDAAEYRQANWKSLSPAQPANKDGTPNYMVGDQGVKRAWLKRNSEPVPDDADEITRASVQARNNLLKQTPVSQMRDEMYVQDLATKDPEGYQQYQQQQQAQMQRIQQMQQDVASQNARIANQTEAQKQALAQQQAQAKAQQVQAQQQLAARQKRHDDFVAAFQRDQQAQRQIEAEQLRQQILGRGLEQRSAATGTAEMQAKAAREAAFAQAEREGEAARQRALEIEEQQRRDEGDTRYQGVTPGDKEVSRATPELLGEAAKRATTIGQLQPEDRLTIPETGGEARGAARIGERLILLSRMATKDTGYHELLHQTLSDMDKSGDRYMMELAGRMRRVHAGEEQLAQQGGEQYQQQVEGRRNMMAKAGSTLKDVYAALSARLGTENPGLLRRNLIAIARGASGPETPLIAKASAAIGGKGIIHYNTNDDFKRYNELVSKIRTAQLSERPSIWKELEEIKNRNGGMPPQGVHIDGSNGTKYQGVEPEQQRRVAGANVNRALGLLGASMYDKNYSQTAVKEMVQNAFDAVKGVNEPTIRLHLEESGGETIGVSDNGRGMTPEIVLTKLLPAFESGKESTESAGGYGLAKVALFSGADDFRVVTVAEHQGQKLQTEVNGDGKAWLDFVNHGADLPLDLNQPGRHTLDSKGDLEVWVKPVDAETTTGTKMEITPSKNYDKYDARKVFKNIAKNEPGTIKFLDEYGTEIKPDAAALAPAQHTVITKGAEVKVHYDPSESPERQWGFPVMNNGLVQFDYPFYEDVKLPSIKINVNPTVDVMNPEYPFTNNRDALKGESRQAVENILKNMSQQYKQKVLDVFQSRMNDTTKIEGSRQRFLDVSGRMKPEDVTEIATDKRIQDLNKALSRVHTAAFKYLNRRFGDFWSNARYKGFANGGGFKGVRFGVPEKGKKGEIYYDLQHVFNDGIQAFRDGKYGPAEMNKAVGESLAGVVLHEISHQVSHSEGEGHAIAMTDLAGPMAEYIRKSIRAVEKTFTHDSDILNFYEWYRDKIKNTELAADEARDFIRQGQRGEPTGQIFSATNREASTRTSEAGGETKFQPVDIGDVLEPQEGRLGKQGYYHLRDERLQASSVHITDDKIHVINLQVPQEKQGKGIGSEVLGKLKGLSDSIGKPIELIAHPDSEKQQEQLNRFYERNGFTKLEGDDRKFSYFPPASSMKYQPVAGHPEDESPVAKEASLKLTQSAIDRIRSIPAKIAPELGDAFQQTLAKKQNLLGQWWNKAAYAINKLSTNEQATLQDVLYNERDSRQKMFVPQKLREAYGAIRQAYLDSAEHQRAINEPIQESDGTMRPIEVDPFYHATTMEPKVADVFRQGTDKAEEQRLTDIFVQHQLRHIDPKITDPEQRLAIAHSNLKDIIASLRGSAKFDTGDHSNQTFYNAARRAEGILLPKEFMRQDLKRNLQVYFMRRAADNAYYEHMESQPKIASALGYTKDAWGNKLPKADELLSGNDQVRAVMNMLKGEGITKTSMQEHAVESLASAVMLGPTTEGHKIVGSQAMAMTYADNPVEAAKMYLHAIRNLGSGWVNTKNEPTGSYAHTLETGYHVLDSKSAHDMLNTHLTAAERLRGLTTGIREIYTIGGLTERFNKSMLQGMAEYLIPSKLAAARNGDAGALALVRHIDPSFTPDKAYTDKQLVAIASEFANLMHGTKDARTLPAWMLHDNEVSSFFKLASWNIAQTNNFMRNVWTPAKQGNFQPLLMSTLGAALGGYALTQLREAINAKRSGVPSFGEMAASERGLFQPALAYQAMAMASYAGFGGILSTVARWPFDIAFRNAPQGATFPLDEEVSGLVKVGNNVVDALLNDPTGNWMNIGAHGIADILKNNIQLARVGYNHMADLGMLSPERNELKATSDKMAELRRFKQVSGYTVDLQGGAGDENPYMNLEQRSFKREQDMGKAMQELPALVNTLVTKYGDKPDVMLSKLRSLKSNSTYETMPSFEDTPLVFTRYLSFLQKREGNNAANARLMDYMQHKIVNAAKASAVP